MHEQIFAIDIGSSAIKGVVAVPSSSEGRIKVIAFSKVSTTGIRRGEIVDSAQVAKRIRVLVEEIKNSLPSPLEQAAVNIGGDHVGVVQSRGVVTVSRADQMISEYDVERVIASSQAVPLPLNREIVHIIPREFIVDGEGRVKSAVGMNGVRLELDALVVYAFSPHVKAVLRTLSEAGLDASGTVISGLAGASAVLSEKEKEIGAVLIDIGAQTTDVVVFEEGQPIHVAVFPVGSFHISNDIAIGLQLDFDVAEHVKITYGHCDPESVSRKDLIIPEMLDGKIDFAISRKELAHIIEARLEEIFELVNNELSKIGKAGLLPGGGTLIGGGAKTAGIVDFAKKEFRLPVRLGQFVDVEGLVGRIDPALFANAVGLAKWKMETMEHASKPFSKSVFSGVGEKLKKIIQGSLP
jgi:cell division protein FtsA